MLKLSMQFFAHKKGVGSTKNDSSYWLATSWYVSAEPTFTPVKMLESAATIHFSHWLTER